MIKDTLIKKIDLLRTQLETERSSFISHWRELGEYILPVRPRFLHSDTNNGIKKNSKIINSTATLAARTLRSGMMSGVTSPARPWFKLGTQDTELNKLESVKAWLHDVTQRMAHVFIRSNLYKVLPVLYGDMGVFGTGCMSVEEDFESVVHFRVYPIGSYMLANDSKDRTRVFIRDFKLTVRQIVEMFAEYDLRKKEYNFKNISSHIKQLWDTGQKEAWIEVCHAIIPNDAYVPNSQISKNKRFKSVYYERTHGDSYGVLLKESGFDYFQILAPKWESQVEDSYATDSPGISSLGYIKQLQIMEKRKAQVVEKSVNPPMVASLSLMNSRTSILPGDVTYADERDGNKAFRSAHDVTIGTADIREDIIICEDKIKKAFYEDLFLMLSMSDRRQITATEIEMRHDEKLLALGPVLEHINQDLLDPLIDITFMIMERQGLIPEPPEELQGQELKVEYVSVMAEAQKLLGTNGVDRFALFAGQSANINPEVLDKINFDKMMSDYADMLSIPPGIIRDDELVAEIRNQRAQAQMAQQQAELIKQGTESARNLSSASLEGSNVLSQIVGVA